MKRISKLLVANRGEIARRVMRTCREMGIGTVAVYADPDADAPFVREADVAVALRGTSSGETYLDIEKVIDTAARTGADAIHPGYGFLSENPEFARRVLDAGLTWVGPRADAIAAMGDKLAAKKRMIEAGVPTLPWLELSGDDFGAVLQGSHDLGFPLLVKAAGGGGGKGMRVVHGEPDLADAIASARREASSAFADDRVFLERYLERARHVEVQIFGDRHGNLVHCFERECSIQRRHQKVIEECPSPAVNDELRQRMGTAAVAAGRAIGYDNAGTVEFMLAPDGEFYFLEVNTRLQVEHPVTEAVTGLDLVREQIRVAEGLPLSFTQDGLALNGHAIEARLYAENPALDFLPTHGRLIRFEPDPALPLRVDSGVETASDVSVHFDPMLAKFIAHAPTRREAAVKLARGLQRLAVHGVTTNRDFLVNVLRSEAFLEGDTFTEFLDVHRPPASLELDDEDLRRALVAAALASHARNRARAAVVTTIPGGWRNNPSQMQQHVYAFGEREVSVSYQPRRDGSFDWEALGQRGHARLLSIEGAAVWFEVEGVRQSVSVVTEGNETWVQGAAGQVHLVEVPRFPEKAVEAVTGGHTAPMPGKIVAVHVQPGDRVARGQVLLILEAMKMEHRILAAEDGVVREVRAELGHQMEAGQLLLVIDGDGDGEGVEA
ncbi:MAG TPA: biotin carboxylase N-terminal domain-containing protein [Tepidiformaceae bacterium]|nr:biotin carboxylase N-terminal domain-containing protein [Tepidiformaceae bacterium]